MKGAKKLRSLYATIVISKNISEIGEKEIQKIKYYKTKDELYGIQVVKNNELQYNEEKIDKIEHITEDENEINQILEILVNNLVTYNFEEIISDVLKSQIYFKS